MFYFKDWFSYNRYDRWIVLGYVPAGHNMETRFRVRWTLKCKYDYFSFCTWIWSLRIQLQEGSPTFDKVNR